MHSNRYYFAGSPGLQERWGFVQWNITACVFWQCLSKHASDNRLHFFLWHITWMVVVILNQSNLIVMSILIQSNLNQFPNLSLITYHLPGSPNKNEQSKWDLFWKSSNQIKSSKKLLAVYGYSQQKLVLLNIPLWWVTEVFSHKICLL